MQKNKTIIIGAGPVGSLAAIYAANRGDEVELYELRADLRNHDTTPLNFTKSINLALSERGTNAIRSAGYNGLLEAVLEQTIPMYGRMIHSRNSKGKLSEESQVYDVHGRFLRSADRGILNACLLNELEKMPNVRLHFQHKLTGADFSQKKAWFEVQGGGHSRSDRPPEIEVTFDLMLGCDGAHSATRFHMMKFARMNYMQEYIDCLWCEFSMGPAEEGGFQISPNHLHIWPAGSCMFIALPNIDKSFVCTLFGPVSLFAKLEKGSEDDLLAVFDQKFPGVTNLIPRSDLISQFKRNPHLPLISIKCSPHHFGDSVVILGDAANAMVPFYGQGMNSGLESVRVLFETMSIYPRDRGLALEAYTRYRTADTYAIADLALANYVEMRSSVTSPLYKIRKAIEEQLHKYVPKLGWATQYSRVSFSNMRFSQVIERSKHQKNVLTAVLAAATAIPAGGILWYLLTLYRLRNSRRS